MLKLVLGRRGHIKYVRRLPRPVLKEIIYNTILQLSLTRSIARKPQSFEGFKRISPAKVKASTNAHFSKKVNWHVGPDLRIG